MNFHHSEAVLIRFHQLPKIFGDGGHSPSTVFWKHGARGRCSGNANALLSAFPNSRSCNKQGASTAAATPFEAHTDAPSISRVAAQSCFQASTASRDHRSADQKAPSWKVERPDVSRILSRPTFTLRPKDQSILFGVIHQVRAPVSAQ